MNNIYHIELQHWLEDSSLTVTKEFIAEANKASARALANLQPLTDLIATEITGRLEMDRHMPAYSQGEFSYSLRDVVGQEKPLFYRTYKDGTTTLIFDENSEPMALLPTDCSQLLVHRLDCDPSQSYLPIALDPLGNERFILNLKNMFTGLYFPINLEVDAIAPQLAWLDSTRFVYIALDHRNRPFQAWLYHLDLQQSELLYEEFNQRISLSVRRSESGQFIFLTATELQKSSVVYHTHCEAANPKFALLRPGKELQQDQLYHQGEYFYLISNHQGENYGLYRTKVKDTLCLSWDCLIPPSATKQLVRLQVFAKHLVLYTREEQFITISVISPQGKPISTIPMPEAHYVISRAENRDFESNCLRFNYSSLLRPHTLYEFNFTTQQLSHIDQITVNGYCPEEYCCEYLDVCNQGVKVPVSLVYKKSLRREQGNPMLLYTYGAYGYCFPDEFTSTRLSLLDRGFIYAIAHVRGGGERGPQWHDKGKGLHKKNSIEDLICCAEFLCEKNYTSAEQLALMGESAGGLVVCAAINQHPAICKAVVAINPFVDVIDTLSNEALPGTSEEWCEWGDPHDPQMAEYIASYDPIKNIRKVSDYPDMLLSCAMHDAQVPYWEACKYYLQHQNQYTNAEIILTINTGGHQNSSARYSNINTLATQYSYLINKLSGPE